MMTKERLSKIKAIADDPRCQPRMREVARLMYERYRAAVRDQVDDEPLPRGHISHKEGMRRAWDRYHRARRAAGADRGASGR